MARVSMPLSPPSPPTPTQLSPHPELRRYDGFAAAFESGFLGWVSLITLPSFALGLVAGPAAAFVQARSATLSASAVHFGPAALGAALLPLVLPACAAGARAAHEWAVLPVIESNRPPVEADGAYTPGAAYQTPTSEEVLVGLEALPSLDPADRARLRWALDGDPASQYPTEAAAAAHAATPEEDAALRASLRDYTARVEAAVAARAAPAAGGERESDFDALVVAVVNAASTQGRGPGGGPQAQGGGAALK